MTIHIQWSAGDRVVLDRVVPHLDDVYADIEEMTGMEMAYDGVTAIAGDTIVLRIASDHAEPETPVMGERPDYLEGVGGGPRPMPTKASLREFAKAVGMSKKQRQRLYRKVGLD